MNKQLINKYKLEFDHWLNGGSTLLGIRNLVSSTIRWYPSIRDPFEEESTSGELLVIINDEYVEFRKALAEGKIIQFKQSENDWWADANSSFNLSIDWYRIKPDEPKFKVGDFVRYIHHKTSPRALEINNINGGRYYFINSEMSCLEHELEPWTPVKNEWCWFYDNPNSNKYCNLSQSGEFNVRYFKTNCGTSWNFCEPFLNSLPSYLKDK